VTDQERQKAEELISRLELSVGQIFPRDNANAALLASMIQTLNGLRDRVMAEPQLARRVRFVSVSFDPTHDTPAALRQYGGRLMSDPRFEWQFLTARSVPELLPVLDGFGQDVRVEKDASGRPTRTMNHMLKMFLIDPDGVVREIYSLAYLQQPVMFNDIKTLALEADSALAKAR